MTKEEIECDLVGDRYESGLTAKPYSDDDKYEAKALGVIPQKDGLPTPLCVAEALKDVFDPELPVNVYDLGLIYDIHVDNDGNISLLMTLTAPNCPVAGILPGEIAEAAATVPGAKKVGVTLTFDTPWNKDMMSLIAQVGLNMF